MVIHIGSAQGGKEKAINRFIDNLQKFPEEITGKLILENDDKVFSAMDVINLCNKVNVPMVLDIHHYMCNNEGEKLNYVIDNAFKTWDNDKLPPKIHFSSPRSGEKDRKHSDYINVDDFVNFIEECRDIGRDFDIM